MGLAFELLGDAGVTGNLSTKEQERLLQAYRAGARNALVSVGLGVGLEPVGPSAQMRPGASPPLAGLLWAETPHER